MAERRRRKSLQSLPRRYTASDTIAAYEFGLLTDSDKTLAWLEARDPTVIDMYQKT